MIIGKNVTETNNRLVRTHLCDLCGKDLDRQNTLRRVR